MKLAYRLSKVCGNAFANGQLVFTADGDSVISPVGNRINIFDLVQQKTATLPFENRKDIQCMAVSHNGRFLISIDVEGHALFVNLPRRVILTRFNFKRPVKEVKFSPNDDLILVTHGHGCQIWRSPGVRKEFSPLVLCREIGGFYDDTTCADWSSDSESVVIGSKDLSARVYYRVQSKNMAMTVLSGHRDTLVGVYYSSAGDMVYTIAADGAVFVWKFEAAERIQNKSGDGSQRGSQWVLSKREFLWDPHTEVSSATYQRTSELLVIGFSNGVYGLYNMPDCTNIHRLSVSTHSLNTVAINSTGEWLALGSSRLGQLVVWEWKSESYALKQQGHLYGLNTLDFSSDGQFIATGGDVIIFYNR